MWCFSLLHSLIGLGNNAILKPIPAKCYHSVLTEMVSDQCVCVCVCVYVCLCTVEVLKEIAGNQCVCMYVCV